VTHPNEVPDDIETDWEYEPDLARCPNCGNFGTPDPDGSGDYFCGVCGNDWNVYEPAPKVP